jgi:hypothetical protein
MKLLSLIFYYPLLIFTSAYDFTLCNNDVILFIDSLFLSPQPNKQLLIQMQGISYKTVSDNNTTMSISVYDIPIFTKNIDLCNYTICPIPDYEPININILENNTLGYPSGIEYNFTIESTVGGNKDIFCVNFLFKSV